MGLSYLMLWEIEFQLSTEMYALKFVKSQPMKVSFTAKAFHFYLADLVL